MQLHTIEGARKYLTASERDSFLKAAEQAGRETRTLCMTLAYAGCRLPEVLAPTADRVDLAAKVKAELRRVAVRTVTHCIRRSAQHSPASPRRTPQGASATAATSVPANLQNA